MNNLSILGRVTSKPHLAYVGASNRPLLKFHFTHTRKTGETHRSIEIGVMIWGAKAELAATQISNNDEVALSGPIDFDSFAVTQEERKVMRPIIIADTITITSRPSVPGQ